MLAQAGAGLTHLPTGRDVRRLLDQHGLTPHKRRGQSFLVDPNTVRSIVRRARVAAGDTVVEIGPGLGALTLALAEQGAWVVAVEVDAGLVRALDEVLVGQRRIRLVHADALEVEWPSLVAAPALLVANLPYNVATPLVLHALESGVFSRLHVMVQREVGQRWAARVGDPQLSGVTIKLATLADVALDQRISRRVFYPVPNVDSVTVRLVPRPWAAEVERKAVTALVDAGFGQRRKRLRNALAGPGRPAAAVETALRASGLSPGARAEELSLDAWITLTKALERSL